MVIDLAQLGFKWKNAGGKFKKWNLPVGYYPHAVEKVAQLKQHGFASTTLKTFRVVRAEDLTIPAAQLDEPEKLLFVTLSRVNILSKNQGRQKTWPLIGSVDGLNHGGENGWAVRVHEILQTPEVALQLMGLLRDY